MTTIASPVSTRVVSTMINGMFVMRIAVTTRGV
jgi:hypothetical protein